MLNLCFRVHMCFLQLTVLVVMKKNGNLTNNPHNTNGKQYYQFQLKLN